MLQSSRGRLQRPRAQGPGDRAHRSQHLPGAARAGLGGAVERPRQPQRGAGRGAQRRSRLQPQGGPAQAPADFPHRRRPGPGRARPGACANRARQAQVRQQQANADSARLDLEKTVIRSPVDGVVLLRAVEPGQTVAASLQTPVLFKIAGDLSQDGDRPGDRRGRHRPGASEGQTARFTVDAFPDRSFVGRGQAGAPVPRPTPPT